MDNKMKNLIFIIIISSFVLIFASCKTDFAISPESGNSGSGKWSMGYYAAWLSSMYPISEIEWAGLTHVAVAFYLPQTNGTLRILGNNPQLAANLVNAAKTKGVKTIASIGGSDTAPGYRQATSSGTIDSFVNNLVTIMDTVGYDGFDIDWEPLETTDQPSVINLINKIRAVRPTAIITIAVGSLNVNIHEDISGYPAIAALCDQMNIMTYGMAGAWSGWRSWHSSPLYHRLSSTPMSVDSTVKLYIAAGIPKSKIGIGIGFYGLGYTPPVTGPEQQLNGSTVVASDQNLSYANIMITYYEVGALKWDSLAHVPYLSWGSAHGPAGCSYISYENEQSIAEKAAYLKSMGLGGVIEWEINEGYIATEQPGERNPLLKAIHDHILH
jgi:chitinase